MWLPIGAGLNPYTNTEKSSPLIVNEACTGLLDFNDPSILFQASCAGCHGNWINSYSSLMSKTRNLSNGSTMPFIQPYQIPGSYLWLKLIGDHALVGGSGNQMPQNGPALDYEDMVLVERWIFEGASQ